MIYTVVNPNFRQAFIRLLSLGAMGKRCRGAVRFSVQNFRGIRPAIPDANNNSGNCKAPMVVRRASKYPPAGSRERAPVWSPNFLTALRLDNETPV